MRCKPGDLAMVVTAKHPLLAHLLGTVIRVTRITVIDRHGSHCWGYAGKRLGACGAVCNAIPDDWLRPICPTEIIEQESA